jgi:integrase
MAYRNEYVNSDAAWRRVTNFRKVSRSRDIFFTDESVNDFLKVISGNFKQLIQLALNTGARYSELRFAKVGDFDAEQKTLTLSGKTGKRTVFLSTHTTSVLKQITKLRHPTAYILVKDDGNHWGEKDHARRFKDAAVASSLPTGSVFYCLRHYYISKALLARVSPQVIAENCGTSVKMIEKHYGKFMDEDRREMMDTVIISRG